MPSSLKPPKTNRPHNVWFFSRWRSALPLSSDKNHPQNFHALPSYPLSRPALTQQALSPTAPLHAPLPPSPLILLSRRCHAPPSRSRRRTHPPPPPCSIPRATSKGRSTMAPVGWTVGASRQQLTGELSSNLLKFELLLGFWTFGRRV